MFDPKQTNHGGYFSLIRRILRLVGKPLEWFFIGIVRAYQTFISPMMPRTCRFYPSCSEYMIRALRRKGPIIGLFLGVWRLIRCNPLSEGGYDPVDRPPKDDDET